MHNARNALLSIGAAIVSAGLARAVSHLEPGDLLRPLRLLRRRSGWAERLAFLGAGVVVGGAAALLFSPTSGKETRAKLARKANGLSDLAAHKVRETHEEPPPAASTAEPDFSNGASAPSNPDISAR